MSQFAIKTAHTITGNWSNRQGSPFIDQLCTIISGVINVGTKPTVLVTYPGARDILNHQDTMLMHELGVEISDEFIGQPYDEVLLSDFDTKNVETVFNLTYPTNPDQNASIVFYGKASSHVCVEDTLIRHMTRVDEVTAQLISFTPSPTHGGALLTVKIETEDGDVDLIMVHMFNRDVSDTEKGVYREHEVYARRDAILIPLDY